jgi:hypothetical protein
MQNPITDVSLVSRMLKDIPGSAGIPEMQEGGNNVMG